MNPIDELFANLRRQGKKAFIPFVTAGDPDLAATRAVIQELARQGASLVEIGFPYSDPIADGPVIQASYTRALAKKIKLDDIFASLRTLSREEPFKSGKVPLVGMMSYSLVHRRGPTKFVEEAKAAGLSGAIVPDLPLEESEPLVKIAAEHDFKLIQLVTPTTPPERAIRIAQKSSGFLYCVSVVGITGERVELPTHLAEHLRWLKSQTKLPLCVGFGISKPEHVRLLKAEADGLIVGSALVRKMEQGGVAEVGALAKELMAAL